MRALANDTLDSLSCSRSSRWASPGPPRSAPATPVRARQGPPAQEHPNPARHHPREPDHPALLPRGPAGSSRGLRGVVVDEWHELLGSKRGVQTELALARLRTLAPGARTWGLSATLGNTDEAARALVGVHAGPARPLVRGIAPKAIEVETLIPETIERYPWAGHIGHGAARAGHRAGSRPRGGVTLLFTNTRVAGGDLVPRDPPRPPRPARAGRPPPRVARPRHPRAGRGPAARARQQPQVRRLHLEPRPGRRLLPRRSGHPGGQPQGCRAPDPARGAVRAPARRGQPGRGRADQRARAHRVRERARRDRDGAHREPGAGPQAPRCAHPAPGHRGDGRGLRRGRAPEDARSSPATPTAT
jgi:hypothetical protein